jgi:hypothetical protein
VIELLHFLTPWLPDLNGIGSSQALARGEGRLTHTGPLGSCVDRLRLFEAVFSIASGLWPGTFQVACGRWGEINVFFEAGDC